MPEIRYPVNPDRNVPWNDLPPLPISKDFYHQIEILEKLVDTKAALARLQGFRAVIPNQGLLHRILSE